MKNIRSKYVKETLLDYENLAQSLKENTTSAVKDLLSEAVRDTYNKILSESFEDDFDEEEVEDTDSDNASTASNDADVNDEGTEDASVETDTVETPSDNGTEESATEVTPDGAVEKTTVGSDGEGNEWSEFEKYKVSDGKYDFSNAEDDEIVKAYKLMKDEDQLVVTKDGDMVHLQDNETGADYIIDLGSVPEEDDSEEMVETEDSFEDDADDEFEDENNMNEQRIFEVALNEYNSNVGYTDNYQKKDVMTNPGMSEPAKSSSTNDWDEGVPHGTEKPWSSKKDKNNAPFTAEKGKTVEESVEECGMLENDEEALEEANLSQSRWNDTHAAHNRVPAANDDAHRRDGIQKTSKGTKYRANGTSELDESIKAIKVKANAIFEENKQLKAALKEFRTTLQEAAVTNVNLGKIIKLISENSTTVDEKKEIIARFGKEAKTIEQSNTLYESISNDLKKKNTMNINEEKQFTASSSKMINETQIYKSNDLLNTLGMMHKICNI